MVDVSVDHLPVLLRELGDQLAVQAGETAVDCTFGNGGHAGAVAKQLGHEGELIAIDRDPEAERRFELRSSDFICHSRFINATFEDGLRELLEQGEQVSAVYFDLGVSSMQIDNRDRGFSYSYDAPLDMRMDPSLEVDAKELVNEWPERQLAAIFRNYGEERYAGKIAHAIVRAREQAEIETTAQLVELIQMAIPTPARFAGGHPAKRVFQAIRIAVNDELGQIDRALPLAWQLLKPGGRLAVISFHSLEDRRVKQFFKGLTRGCICPPGLPVCGCGCEPEAELVDRRSTVPTDSEIDSNPRARSARLRVARKL